MSYYPRYPGDPQNGLISPLLVSVLFGLAAGAVGMLLASAYLMPTQPQVGPGEAPRGSTILIPEETAPAQELARSTALFYDALTVDRLRLVGGAKSLVPGDAFGAGFVLTSDGWLVAHASSFPKGKLPLNSYAVIAGRAYKVKSSALDPFTNLLFIRVDGGGLQVAAFGSAQDLVPGGSAFAFDRFGGFRRLDVAAFDDLAVTTALELHWTSERLQNVVHLSRADGLLPGSMLLSRKGEIVAVYAGSDASGAYAVPYDAFRHAYGSVLKDGKITRPFLGARYYDLTRLSGAATAPQRGALLAASPDGRLASLAPRSPAESAGLLAGDIVTAVNGEEVSAKAAFSDLVSDYSPGETIELTVFRTGQEQKITVLLGSNSR